MVISDVILRYLQQHRRLVIPSLGAFMVKESGEVLFSELLKNDDGVLSTLLTSEGLSEFEIAAVTDRFIFEVRHAIEQEGCYLLGDWGALVKSNNGSLIFEKREGITPTRAAEPKSMATPQTAPAPKATPKVAPIAMPTEISNPKGLDTTEEIAPQAESFNTKESAPKQNIAEPKTTPQMQVKRPAKAPRPAKKGADKFVILAVIVLLLALAAIGYGYYVSQLSTETDDMKMDALRVPVERPANN